MGIVIPLALLATAWVLLRLEVEPVPTWFYVCTWYPTLLLLDQLAHRLDGRPALLGEPRRVVSLFGWSAVIWLVFEAANFRLANWYYVFVPRAPLERWTGILVSFATVVPAITLMAQLLDAASVGHRWRGTPLTIRSWELHAATALGVTSGALALAVPTRFFALVWVALWLLIDPLLYRARPSWSLIGDLARGEWGRIGRLLLGGLAVGGLWELYNHYGRGKWIYTVPGLEELKLFEMPLIGFFGFPFFALEAWVMYHGLCALRVAVPVELRPTPRTAGRRGATEGDRGRPAAAVAVALAVAFVIATMLGIERWTISSTVPRLADLAGVTAEQVRALRKAGIGSVFRLARATPDALVQEPGLAGTEASRLVETARLVTLRGIGTEHASRLSELSVSTVCDLAQRQPALLWNEYHADRAVRHSAGPPVRPTPAEVRVWVRTAQRACG